ncbi:hypothetical protein ACIHCV_33105 [Streptomyces sp. NPDC051956]|uniref:hypothetical protein n=1 Tax=Streptomyces sp. NPDC051956 TaxID=3365677 RepID=UPI0037D37F54
MVLTERAGGLGGVQGEGLVVSHGVFRALAATGPDALCAWVTEAIGPPNGITAVGTTPLLAPPGLAGYWRPGAVRSRPTDGEDEHVIQLPQGSWWDWDVFAWDPGRLCLGAGHDISYSHGLELVFGAPVFVTCPAAFQDPVFREPTADEIRLVVRQVGETPPVLVAFEADAGGPSLAFGLIGAGQLDIVQGTVFRYWRESLAAGERLAPWVGPPV